MQDTTLANLFNRVGSLLLRLSQESKNNKISTEDALPLCINYTFEGETVWKLVFSAGSINYIKEELEQKDGYCYTFNDTLEYSETVESFPTEIESAFLESKITLTTEEDQALNDLENRVSKGYYESNFTEESDSFEDEWSALSTKESVEAWKNGTLSVHDTEC
ncbi:unnamed protein product [Blepharisma stoltei]|uniref:Uncharacterized protein n=1 Tax=Blepharisma stoltei TaxID=1481888 RepID=A0AAU9JAU5_9CILI|nr:unnamed protein product [Blepharisma stoltei]